MLSISLLKKKGLANQRYTFRIAWRTMLSTVIKDYEAEDEETKQALNLEGREDLSRGTAKRFLSVSRVKNGCLPNVMSSTNGIPRTRLLNSSNLNIL